MAPRLGRIHCARANGPASDGAGRVPPPILRGFTSMPRRSTATMLSWSGTLWHKGWELPLLCGPEMAPRPEALKRLRVPNKQVRQALRAGSDDLFTRAGYRPRLSLTTSRNTLFTASALPKTRSGQRCVPCKRARLLASDQRRVEKANPPQWRPTAHCQRSLSRPFTKQA
jgi:hypothetical protein